MGHDEPDQLEEDEIKFPKLGKLAGKIAQLEYSIFNFSRRFPKCIWRLLELTTLFFIFLNMLVAPICFAAAVNYHSKEAHYSLTVPNGWIQIPKNILQQKSQEMSKENPDGKASAYDLALQKSSGTYFTYPYMLVHIEPRGHLSDDDLKTMAAAMNQQFKETMITQIPGFLSDEKRLGEVYYVSKSHTIFFSSSAKLNSDDVTTFTAGIAGKDRITFLQFYCLKADLAKDQPVFMSIVNSLKYESDYQYPSSLWSSVLENKWTKPIAAGIGPLSGAIAGLFKLVSFLKNRKVA